MPRPASRLANCYVPLPISLDEYKNAIDAIGSGEDKSSGWKRQDGRQAHELRQLYMERSVSNNNNPMCLGSALVELGHTKVLSYITVAQSSDVHPELVCKVQYLPFIAKNGITQRVNTVTPLDSGSATAARGTGNSQQQQAAMMYSVGKLQNRLLNEESQLGRQIHSALSPTILLLNKDDYDNSDTTEESILNQHFFGKCAIVIHTTVLQDDGSILSACITSAMMALIDAKVPLQDIVTSCTVAVLKDPNSTDEGKDEPNENDKYCADPTEAEMKKARAVIILAMTPNHKEVTLWNQSGRLTSANANKAMELCRNGCRTMHKFIRNSIVQ